MRLPWNELFLFFWYQYGVKGSAWRPSLGSERRPRLMVGCQVKLRWLYVSPQRSPYSQKSDILKAHGESDLLHLANSILLFDAYEASVRSWCDTWNQCLPVWTICEDVKISDIRINSPSFNIPRSPETKLSFCHFKQCMAGKLDLSPSKPSSLRSHQAKAGVVPLLHHWCVDQRRHWPPSHTPPSPNLLTTIPPINP